ncbi:siphovirus Gp157 family protein [Microvirga yunnanensis]|uniref:siphovirus Gp157 family protein n=1 Tax=Microvirga yunnanensis TaxID=2953740 RepID=UPI0021CA412A|nr:siphovirus Gp157 family protein [Microvirga sp. HBU65207]
MLEEHTDACHFSLALPKEVKTYTNLKQSIKQEFDLDEHDPALLDTLEGVSDLPELLARAAQSVLLLKAQAKGIDGLIDSLEARKVRYETRADRLRQKILHAMLDTGLKRLPTHELTVLVKSGGQEVDVHTQDLLPEEFLRIKVEPNKQAIGQALKAGENVPGATLVDKPPVLYLRV